MAATNGPKLIEDNHHEGFHRTRAVGCSFLELKLNLWQGNYHVNLWQGNCHVGQGTWEGFSQKVWSFLSKAAASLDANSALYSPAWAIGHMASTKRVLAWVASAPGVTWDLDMSSISLLDQNLSTHSIVDGNTPPVSQLLAENPPPPPGNSRLPPS